MQYSTCTDIDVNESASPVARAMEIDHAAQPMIESRNTRMRRLTNRVRQLAQHGAPIVLQGERGCGKSLMAHMIHQWSPFANRPAVQFACGHAPPEMLRALLRNLSGEHAAESDSGKDHPISLILDEVEHLNGPLLEILLQAIERWTSTMDPIPVSRIRVVAIIGSHIGEQGSGVRGDFAERLGEHLVTLPALRERREDILLLANHCLEQGAVENHRGKMAFTPEAQHALEAHPWSGNVRELRAVIQWAATIAERPMVDVNELALRRPTRDQAAEEFPSLDAVERAHILRIIRAMPTLEEAARVLKVDITTLWRKRRRYGI